MVYDYPVCLHTESVRGKTCMTNIRVMSVALFGVMLLSACGTARTGGEPFSSIAAEQTSNPADGQPSPPVPQKASTPAAEKSRSPASQKLALGIASYENYNFKSSLAELRSALHLGLSSKQDQVLAHKYLAFIHCISKRKTQCGYEFRMALKIDPAFELEPAEAGHPIWGPVFLSEKSRYAK